MKKFKFKINGNEYEVSVNEMEQNIAEIEVNGTPFTVEIERQEKNSAIALNKKPAGKVAPIQTPSHSVIASAIKAPLPGSVMKVLVTVGQTVKRGDLLLTMESMKMENNILAENNGIIKKIYVQTGETVMQNDILIDFEGTDTPATATVSTTAPVTSAPVSAPIPTAAKVVKSPLPGNILKIAVTLGQKIKRGDLLLTLESMKMENSILSEKDAIVKKIYVNVGQTVLQEDPLFDLE